MCLLACFKNSMIRQESLIFVSGSDCSQKKLCSDGETHLSDAMIKDPVICLLMAIKWTPSPFVIGMNKLYFKTRNEILRQTGQ